MAESDFSWIYLLIFIAIPLSRILPRLLKRRSEKNKIAAQRVYEEQVEQSTGDTVQEHTKETPSESSKPQTNDMRVLGELNIGVKKFENILKNTGLDGNELSSILKDLEKRGLMRVEEKKGIAGTKIELYATEKGFKKYYS